MVTSSNPEDLRIRAAKVAGAASLRDLRLTASQTEAMEVPAPGQELGVELKIELEANSTENHDIVALLARFDVSISKSEDEEIQRIATISCTFTTVFEMQQPVDWTDEELKAFANTTGVFAVYPYAREFVSDATTRMGLPTLTLDFLKR